MSVTESVRIGTAAWTIPAAFAQEFAKDGSHLERYAKTLNAVEINTSFYKDHQAKTYARWAESTPAHFRFAVKLRKTLTHEKKLDVTKAELRAVLDPIQELGEKWEILLVQLAPSLEFNVSVAKAFFQKASAIFAGGIVCEPRHPSWMTPQAQTFFADHGIGRVWADPAKSALDTPVGTPFYQRLHGSPAIYKSNYENERLENFARQQDAAAGAHTRRWCIFDNTTFGFATDNAVTLTHMMSSKKAPRSRSR